MLIESNSIGSAVSAVTLTVAVNAASATDGSAVNAAAIIVSVDALRYFDRAVLALPISK